MSERIKNKEREREYNRRYRERNRLILAEKSRLASSNRVLTKEQKERRRITSAKRYKLNKELLTNSYICACLVRHNSLTYKEIPKELIEAKRLQIQLKRSIEND